MANAKPSKGGGVKFADEVEEQRGDISIVDSLQGTSVLVTGGTGFVGTCVLDALLRKCHVQRVVLLLRQRRGVTPNERVLEMLQSSIFDRLREEIPLEVLLKRVEVVTADLSAPGLGIEGENRDNLFKDGGVNYIIHSAASIKLMEPFKKQLQTNYGATYDLLEIANEMPNMKGFLYVSTAFVNANLPPGSVCSENMQPLFKSKYASQLKGLPFNDQESMVKYFLQDSTNEEAEKMSAKLMGIWGFWSTYIMTKNWTEKHVRDCHEHKTKYNFQTCIVRPALITSCAKDPHPGYISNNAGPAGMALAFGHGLLDYSPYKPDRVMDMIPGDFVANTILLGCASMKCFPQKTTKILQSSSSLSNPITVGKYFDLVQEYFEKEPINLTILTNMFGIRVKNKVRIKFVSGLEKAIRKGMTVAYWKFCIHVVGSCVAPKLKKAMVMGYGATKLLLNEDVAKGLFFDNSNTSALYTSLGLDERREFPCVWSPSYSWDKYTPIFLEGVKITQPHYIEDRSLMLDPVPKPSQSARGSARTSTHSTHKSDLSSYSKFYIRQTFKESRKDDSGRSYGTVDSEDSPSIRSEPSPPNDIELSSKK